MKKFTIENIAGGNRKSFEWTGSFSMAALRHAADCMECGGPRFGGDCGDEAADEWEKFYRSYLAGEFADDPEIERLFNG